MLSYQLPEPVIYVFYKMEFIRDFCHGSVKCSYGRAVISRPVTTDKLYLLMFLHPFTETLRLPVTKQVYRPAFLEVYDKTPICHTLAPCPVIHTNLTDVLLRGRAHSVKVS